MLFTVSCTELDRYSYTVNNMELSVPVA